MNLDDALQTFLEESRDLLDQMEEALLICEQTSDIGDTVNVLFRAAHTIKGSAGLFGLDHIVSFTHVVESLLDRVRSAELKLNTDLIALLMSSRDHISDLIDQLILGIPEPNGELKDRGAHIIRHLQKHLGDAPKTVAITPPSKNVNNHTDALFESLDTDRVSSGLWHISLRFAPDVLIDGMDPLSFLRYLATLGCIEHIHTLYEAIPAAEQMDAETCYIGFEIGFDSTVDKTVIETTFDFLRDGSQINIIAPHSPLADYARLINALPEENQRIGEILINCGSLTQDELQQALAMIEQAKPVESGEKKSKVACSAPSNNAGNKQKSTDAGKSSESRFIRVDSEKLDHLINLVGELIIAGASTSMVARKIQVSELQESTSILSRLVEDVRNTALNLRMVQIGATFNRFQRVVRDVSHDLGKDIELVISGAETELDKTVIEKIGDPLTHLVRNSMDHGIESVAVRRARGKPDKGTLQLNAYHESGSIVIEISDDGGGLDRNTILAKAIEKGLVNEAQSLSDQDVFNLIFEPGFSTAKQVSNLSGRGVGMDVVRRNIQDLRGTVDLSSKLGEGTTVSIRLPLTLAIIDGFLVGIGNATYVVPLDMVVECIELAAWNHEADDKRYLNLRGEVMPYLRLHEHFGITERSAKQENVVILSYAGMKFGLVVEKLMGEFQTVIKPLGDMFGKVKGISGFTILGGGDVALVLDMVGLMQQISLEQAHFEMAY